MTNKFIDDGGHAFPQSIAISPSGVVCRSSYDGEGMSLRDYFAGQALAGMIGHTNAENDVLAKTSFEVADAMLKARRGKT